MHRVRRRFAGLIPVIVALAVGCSATAATAANHPTRTLNLAGKWSGTYNGAVTGSFTLQWRQAGTKLIGTITLSNPRGKYRVSGSLRGSAISFGAVTVGATYTGTAKSKSMSGRWKSGPGGGSWSASRA